MLLVRNALSIPLALLALMGSLVGHCSEPALPPLAARLPKETKVRPFITDDARVVGNRLAQLETWVRADRHAWQHWNLFAYGPKPWLEVTTGFVYGTERQAEGGRSFSYALPLVQAKFLVREYKPNRLPGLGGVIGTFLPGGRGSFRPPGYGAFGYLTVSQCFLEGEKILLHANVGSNYLHINNENQVLATWGLGTQVRTYKGFHLVGEVFSGDPYVPGTGTAYQVGFRHFISDLIQVDMTVGEGIAGANPMPLWGSAGLRLVTTAFRDRSRRR